MLASHRHLQVKLHPIAHLPAPNPNKQHDKLCPLVWSKAAIENFFTRWIQLTDCRREIIGNKGKIAANDWWRTFKKKHLVNSQTNEQYALGNHLLRCVKAFKSHKPRGLFSHNFPALQQLNLTYGRLTHGDSTHPPYPWLHISTASRYTQHNYLCSWNWNVEQRYNMRKQYSLSNSTNSESTIGFSPDLLVQLSAIIHDYCSSSIFFRKSSTLLTPTLTDTCSVQKRALLWCTWGLSKTKPADAGS